MRSSRKTTRVLAAGVLAASLGAGLVPTLTANAMTPQTGVTTEVQAQAGSVVEVDTSNIAQVKEMAKTKPVVFLVTAPSWCGACKQLDPVIRDINAKDGGAWVLAIIDEDKSGGAEKEFGVRGLPTMIPWGKNGEMTSPARMVGWGGESKTRTWIDSVVKAYGPAEPGPAPTTPAPTQPAPSRPAPTQPAPSRPAPTQPAPSRPAPTTPAPEPGDGTLPPLPEGAVQLTDQNYQKEVVEESAKRTVVIDISKDKCEPCLAIAPIMDEKYRQDQGAWQYTRLDGTAYPELWKKFDNPWFPTLIAIRDGKEISRRTGYEGDAAAVRTWLDAVAKGEAPATDPLVMDLKTEEDWKQVTAMSMRHPVALRVHLDPYLAKSRQHGEMAATMAKGDGGKWTLVNANMGDSSQGVLRRHGVRATTVPQMFVVYNGKIQLKPLNGPVDQATMRAWVDTMLSTHYPPA